MNNNFVHQINGIDFHFLLSADLNGKHATINLEVIDPNKSRFEKLHSSISILEELATDKLINLNSENYILKVNQIKTNSQWFGQFELANDNLKPSRF